MSIVLAAVGFAGQASANSRYAAYVMDANTGKVLFSSNANERRYPASLTKMMTLYMVFEALETKKISKKTQVPFSKNAAAEPPTKLGVRAGRSISIDTAIRALVTRSANDVATAVAELLGGSESKFAQMMTRKAGQLGMKSTQFRNAHGLSDSKQFTTARDMAILGIALREHFPQYYSYFSTRSFMYGKQRISTHNRMFGKVKGVDGIKTGYTNASGFNIVTSIKNNGRNIVAVVMGGKSARSRDSHMAALIREQLPRASRGGGGNLVPGHRSVPGQALVASLTLPNRNIPMPSFRPASSIDVADKAAPSEIPTEIPLIAYAPHPTPAPVMAAMASNTLTPPLPVGEVPIPVASAERFGAEADTVDPMMTASTRQAGWVIQIASSATQSDALAVLVRTSKQASPIVGSADAFIEEFDNKGTTYYRARFGGFESKTQAWEVCSALKKQKIDCYAVAI